MHSRSCIVIPNTFACIRVVFTQNSKHARRTPRGEGASRALLETAIQGAELAQARLAWKQVAEEQALEHIGRAWSNPDIRPEEQTIID